MVAIFNYGSNSCPQLRARVILQSMCIYRDSRTRAQVQNPALMSVPAWLDDYVRVFCLRSGGWGGGGVASLCPCPGARTYGSVVWLSQEEKARLDAFEGGYREIEVEVAASGEIPAITAIAYVAGDEGTRFTPPMSREPSDAYLAAVHLMLREHNWNSEIEIRSSKQPETVLRTWRHPGAHALGSLEALAVDINAELPAAQRWTMPSGGRQFSRTLSRAGIADVAGLATGLAEDVPHDDYNPRRVLDNVVFDTIRNRLSLQCVFVYGTLKRGYRNHGCLGQDAVFLGTAQTNRFRLYLHTAGHYPFLLDDHDDRDDDNRDDDNRDDDDLTSTPPPIDGEIFAVTTATLLDVLDPLEDHPNYYRRRRLELTVASEAGCSVDYAWVYVLVDRDVKAAIAARDPTYPEVATF